MITRTILFLCLAAAAEATSLPAPITLAECVDGSVIDDPTSCTASGNDASASGSLTLSPFVSLTAQSASGPINDLFNPGAGVFVSAKYSFQVVGGNPGDQIPILISTNLTSNGSSFSHAYGFAEMVITTSFGTTSVVVCSNGTCGTNNTSFSGTLAWSANAGDIDTLQLEIEAQSGDSPFAEFANASADPFIFVDPSFANAETFSIAVSPGVGNGLASPVPEPGTFGLIGGSALALLFGNFRRRSRFIRQKTVSWAHDD
jgi:PEP-CTERM motif